MKKCQENVNYNPKNVSVIKMPYITYKVSKKFSQNEGGGKGKSRGNIQVKCQKLQ